MIEQDNFIKENLKTEKATFTKHTHNNFNNNVLDIFFIMDPPLPKSLLNLGISLKTSDVFNNLKKKPI